MSRRNAYRKPAIRIRYGAAHNEVIVNGLAFGWGHEDYGGIGKDGRREARGMILGHLRKCGFFARPTHSVEGGY